MAKARIVLHKGKGKERKDGTYPISLEIYHNRIRRYYRTGYSCKRDPELWDERLGRYKSKWKNAVESNKDLSRLHHKAEKIIRRLEDEEIPFHHELFAEKFLQNAELKNLKNYFEYWIRLKQEEGKFNTAAQYRLALNHIERFCRLKRKDINFRSLSLNGITVFFIHELDHYLRTERKCSNNGISVYLRAIKTILNKAIQAGIIDKNPFARFKIKKDKTRKRAISWETIMSMSQFNPYLLPEQGKKRLTLDLFVLSYYTQGANFADIIHWTRKNIVNGRMIYTRRKNNYPYSFTLSRKAKEIIGRYLDDMVYPDNYIFPILDNRVHITHRQINDRWHKVRVQMNRILKEDVAPLFGIEDVTSFSFYVARHSFATHAIYHPDREKRATLDELRQLLGHSDIQTTQLYVKSLPSSELDEVVAKIYA